jgi:CheY-like chemotaxis protein
MLGKKKILIVEDEAMIAFDLAVTVEELDGEVAAICQDIPSALDAATRMRIDAAILDYDVNGVSVESVASALRQRDIPFIVNTANVAAVAANEEFRGIRICPKPVRGRLLSQALSAAMSVQG